MIYSYFILCYLIGSVSFAIIVSYFFKLNDPRSYGSLNAGATNVMRSGNKKAALLTLIGDLLKGTLSVVLPYFLFRSHQYRDIIIALAGVLVVLGHIYPVFFKFRGGKGVATAIGVLLGFNIYLAILFAITWIIVFKLSKISSLAALIAISLSPIYAYLLTGNSPYLGATLIITFFVLYKHKSNLFRLLKGKEASFKKQK